MRAIDADALWMDIIHAMDYCDDILKIIERQPTIETERKKGKWIPCSERLPEKYIGTWLCCCSDGEILFLQYDTPGNGDYECKFYYSDDDGYPVIIKDVIAWMPLPEPWEGEQP